MTPDERQALREKHRDNGIDGRCETCHYVTPIEGTNISVCTAPNYPCDVIKVLDATEPRCEHVEGGEVADGDYNIWLSFTYCPLCGEEL